MQPTVSPTERAEGLTFAIPFYTGRAYLERALESVLAQDDPSWRAFVCDNASPEPGITDLVQRVGRGRIGYVRNEANLGMVGNFNRCIDRAETDLVTLLHSDDELAPGYCRTMRAAAARHPTAVALFCRTEVIDASGHRVFSVADAVKDLLSPSSRGEAVLEGERGMRALVTANIINAPTLCFRKSVLGTRRFDAGFQFVLDWELTTSLLLDGESIVGVPDRCYRYRRHGENTTDQLTRTQQRYREESAFYDQLRDRMHDRGWRECERVARNKRVLKLNVTYGTLKSAAHLQLRDAHRGYKLLRQL